MLMQMHMDMGMGMGMGMGMHTGIDMDMWIHGRTMVGHGSDRHCTHVARMCSSWHSATRP